MRRAARRKSTAGKRSHAVRLASAHTLYVTQADDEEDLNGMDFNSVFDVPLASVLDDRATGYVGAQGQMSRGMGAGGVGSFFADSEPRNKIYSIRIT